jgi:hypothetical protein
MTDSTNSKKPSGIPPGPGSINKEPLQMTAKNKSSKIEAVGFEYQKLVSQRAQPAIEKRDAKLLALGVEYQKLAKWIDALDRGAIAYSEDRSSDVAKLAKWIDLKKQILALPAFSMAGLCLKADVAAYYLQTDDDPEALPLDDASILKSLVNGIKSVVQTTSRNGA